MATEFTKGPWKVVGLTDFFHRGDKLFVDGPIDANIDPEIDARFSVAVIDGPDAIGNARLIAAAPCLLEALKEAETLVLGWACHYEMRDAKTEADYDRATTPEGWHPTHRGIFEKVRAAIAKAEATNGY